jgi:hypothetical protein
MKLSSKIAAAVMVMASAQAFATQIMVKNSLRGEARYYVRYDEINQNDANAVGVAVIPGTLDDEGYCQISGYLPYSSGQFQADLNAGDVLVLKGEASWTRKVYSYKQNQVIAVQDHMSKLVRKSDGQEFKISCSIDSSASETAPYLGINDVTTKVYLTTLGLIVK